MKKSRFNETQIIDILQEQEEGMKVSEICRKHGISEEISYLEKEVRLTSKFTEKYPHKEFFKPILDGFLEKIFFLF